MLHEHLYSTRITTLNDEIDGGTKQAIVQWYVKDDVLFQWNLLEMDDDPTSYDMELLIPIYPHNYVMAYCQKL